MGSEPSSEECFNRSPQELKPLFNEAYALSRTHFSNVLYLSVPGMIHFDTAFYTATDPYRFPSISVTGERCSLNCKHCSGKILKNMIPATTPDRLLEVCTLIKKEGGYGCLISGGALKNGSVPLNDFIPTIKRIKRDLDLEVVVHTGILYPELAESLADAKIDAAMIDVIGSNETLRSVYNADFMVDVFDRSLSLLQKNRIPFVPHIVSGIHYGKLKGEQSALQIISKYKPAAVIVVAFMPLESTPMEFIAPLSPIDTVRVILASRFMMPDTPVMLGCARPRGHDKSETDVLAIKAGVNGIAYPSEDGYLFAKKIGLNIRFSEECCALAYKHLSISTPTIQ